MSSSAFDAIERPKAILKISGNWPEDSTAWYRIRGIISLLLGTFIVATLSLELAKVLDDYEILAEHLASMITGYIFFLKLVIFRSRNRQFLRLIQQLNVKLFNNYPKHLSVIMKNYVRMFVVLQYIYQSMCYTVLVLYCIMPFLSKRDLPMRFSYDLGPFKSLMYIFQALGLTNAIFVHINLDLLAVTLIGMAGAQIDILNQKIIGFKTMPNDNEQATKIYMSNIKDCVKHHIEIIRYIENLESVFSFIFLVQYMMSGAALCIIGFQLVIIKPASFQFVNLVFFFVATTSQLGMYCWFGNEITIKSAATILACYESGWRGCDVKVLKMLIIITERCKRSLFLTAGKFSIVSLASFASVMNAAYSYFALMQNLYRNTKI